MYTVYLAGSIASGKSSVARQWERLGARRIDLDVVSREVLGAGLPCTLAVAREFGDDLLDPRTGELDRALLAKRAFASKEAAGRLEAIELPFIGGRLLELLGTSGQGADVPGDGAAPCTVVEIPLLDRMGAVAFTPDETVCVLCPRSVRRARAIARGMTPEGFDARDALQPGDAWLKDRADTVIENDGAPDVLAAKAAAWWAERERQGWKRVPGRTGPGEACA